MSGIANPACGQTVVGADIADYLEQRGHRFNGFSPRMTRCPFHPERTPSFAVYADGHWHCHSCHDGGSFL